MNQRARSPASSPLSDAPSMADEAYSHSATADAANAYQESFLNDLMSHANPLPEQPPSDASDVMPQLDGATDDKATKPLAKRQPKRVAPKPAKRPASTKKPKLDKWSAEYVLQNPKTPLAYASLEDILSQPAAWDCLTAPQRQNLISLLPAHQTMVLAPSDSTDPPRLDSHWLKYNTDWRHALSRVKEDITEGRNDPEWQRQALVAYKKRKEGDFDTFKDREFEEFWGMKQKLAYNVIAGQSSTLKMETLFERNVLRVGDIFAFARRCRVGGQEILLEKEAKASETQEGSHKPKFTYPPGQFKFSRPGEDLESEFLTSPESLMRVLMAEDARVKFQDVAAVSAWKMIRVVRKNQDLGTMWDLRQAAFFDEDG